MKYSEKKKKATCNPELYFHWHVKEKANYLKKISRCKKKRQDIRCVLMILNHAKVLKLGS